MSRRTRWLTVEEVADLWRVHPQTVRRWVRFEEIEAVREGPKRGRSTIRIPYPLRWKPVCRKAARAKGL